MKAELDEIISQEGNGMNATESHVSAYNLALDEFVAHVEGLTDKAGRPLPGSKKFAKIARDFRLSTKTGERVDINLKEGAKTVANSDTTPKASDSAETTETPATA